jgi:hypothetical protein
MNATITPTVPVPVMREQLRLLKWNELVRPGDFVAAGRRKFALWDGPKGFRADAFVAQIYRRLARAPAATGTKTTP